ncbi:polysaccharide biosynthesis tyrosine autokinase [Pseudonocardia alni]
MQASAVVAELEKPRDPLAVPAVELRVVQPAQAPTDPSSPGWPIITTCGTLAGLILGVGFAIIRSRLDRTVGSAEQLADAASIANLASIPIDAAFNDVEVVVQGQPHGVAAEAFRQLRTNLQFVDIDNPNKVLLVTSSQSGEGKSTTVANLASALSAAGKRVLIIEADLRRPRQASLLGLDASVGLTQIFSERLAARDVTQQWGGGVFDVILAGHIPPNPSELLGSQHMQLLLDDARRRYDYVLVDCPPVLPVTDTIALSPATDGVLFVCRLEVTTVPQVAASMSALRAASANVVGTEPLPT